MYKLMMLLLIAGPITVCMAKKKEGRAPAKEIEVSDSISYTVLNYRTEKVLRANQIGIAYKKHNAGKKLPVVVFIHGGGWSKGDKDQMAYMALTYAKQDFVGVTISYRLLSEAKYPAQVQDAKEAIRFIKSLAGEYPIDINRIGVCGYSAGAHLATLIALSPDEPWYKSDKYTEFDSTVQCAVGISAPLDFTVKHTTSYKVKFLDEQQKQNVELIRKSSPISFINNKQIPIFLLHGDADGIVPPYHYKNFAAKAEEQGVTNLKLYISPNGGHMFFFKEGKLTYPLVMDYFSKLLKGK